MGEDISIENSMASIVEEFLDALRRGERPSVEAYVARSAENSGELRRVLPMLALLEEAKSESPSGNPSRESAASITSPPQRLGDYRILREIGRGGMGVVYEAEQESLGRRVALKVLVSHALFDPKYVKRFQREARAAAQLHHSNIVPVFGVGEHDGRHYIVMQFVPGQGLDRIIAELRQHAGKSGRSRPTSGDPVRKSRNSGESGDERPDVLDTIGDSSTESLKLVQSATIVSSLSSADRRHWQNIGRVGLEIARALAYAHSHGTLHRDLKPSNLLIDTAGTAWITDFGLAKSVEEEDLTATGEILGTLRYLPPEALRGQFDARGDLFGLGLTLFELCALVPARPAASREELIRQVAHDPVRSLMKLRPDVPRDLATIIHKATDIDSSRRYQSATDLAADLERFCADRPIQARPITAVERGWRWCRRNPVVAATVAAATVAVAASLGVAFASIVAAKNDALAAAATQAELRMQADERAIEARDNLKFARQVMSKYLTIMGDSAELKAKGLDPVRRKLLTNAREFYDRLVDQRGDDPDLRADRAGGYVRLGLFLHDMGRFQDGLALVQQAEPILESLVRDFPQNDGYADKLADCYGVQSRIQQKLSRYDTANDLQERALAIYERLAQRHPNDWRRRFALAKAYELLGVSYAQQPGDRRCEEPYRKALPLVRQLVDENPRNGEATRFLSELLGNLGVVHTRQRDYSPAESLLTEAVEIGKKLHHADREHVRNAGNFALVSGYLGSLYEATGRPDDAAKNYETAIDLFTRLSERRPEVSMYQDYRAANLRKLGLLHAAQKRWSEAAASLATACEVRQTQVQRSASPRFQIELATTRRDLGLIRFETGQDRAAADDLARSGDLLMELYERQPQALPDPLLPAVSYLHLGRVQLRLGDFDAVTQALRHAKRHIDEALSRATGTPAEARLVERAAALRRKIERLERRPPEPPDHVD